jgi:hypothetical protein
LGNEYLEDLFNKILDEHITLLNKSPYIKMKTLKFSSNNKSKKRLLEILLNINEEYIKNLHDINLNK